MRYDDRNEDKNLDPPDDTTLPFFAYGIFKPGQLAYSKIKNHVYEHIDDIEINYEMMIRDGVPILIDRKSDYHQTRGSLITFKEGREEKAYGYISETILRKLYEWQTIEIDGKPVNILFGVDPRNGSNYIEDPHERVSFNGKNDPFFHEAVDMIERNLNSIEFSWDIENFFELQMNYMLLWSAIERYCKLKYDVSNAEGDYLKELSNDEVFINAFESVNPNGRGPIYAAKNASPFYYNKSRPNYIINYYYTIRCNVAHRGKEPENSTDKLISSLKDLLKIFKKMIDDTFI